MATVVFIGSQVDVAQVSSFTISTYDGATTYILTVGADNLTVVISVIGDTDATVTATNLKTAWNDSTHPYCNRITATSATDTVTLTADTKGVPFTVVSSKSGGSGVFDSETVVTANQSPSDVDDAANYAGGSKAANSDTFIHDKNAPALAWGLDQSAITGVTFHHIRGSGNIGLDRMAFAISSDGQTVDGTVREYREDYLKFDMSVIHIGEESGPSTIAAATRIKLDNTKSGASQTTIHSVAGISIDPGIPTLRLMYAHADADIDVISATGGWGIAVDDDSETATAGDIVIFDVSGDTKTFLSNGATWTTFDQNSGVAVLHNALAGKATLNISGGTCEMLGTYTTGPDIVIEKGATVLFSTASATASTITLRGIFDMRKALAKPLLDTIVISVGAVLMVGPLGVTTTVRTEPASGLYTVTYN